MTVIGIGALLPHADVETQHENNGVWVKAVHEPPPINRFKAAWAVLTGRAYAVRWPKPGEFEIAMMNCGYPCPLSRGN